MVAGVWDGKEAISVPGAGVWAGPDVGTGVKFGAGVGVVPGVGVKVGPDVGAGVDFGVGVGPCVGLGVGVGDGVGLNALPRSDLRECRLFRHLFYNGLSALQKHASRPHRHSYCHGSDFGE